MGPSPLSLQVSRTPWPLYEAAVGVGLLLVSLPGGRRRGERKGTPRSFPGKDPLGALAGPAKGGK
jgi:hypothetical protein